MRAELANPFITAAVEVFRKELRVKLNRKDLKKKDAPIPSMPISIIIGVTGPVRGQVVYSLDTNFAYGVAKAMLPGKLPVEIRKLVNSAISEIANIITGKASIELAGEDKTISITPPVVFTGNDYAMDFLNIPTIALSFISEMGVIEVNIALTEE
jgi:chemotaxis protein CheX